MTEGMMGRSSDTRMYAPRSESSHMFRENHEDERTRTGYEDPRDREGKADKRQAKKEKEEEEDRGIRHIKVRRHHLSAMHDDEEEEEGLDDSTKLDADREVGLQTNPMGTGGFLTSLAMGAKGPGAAHGHMVATGEPMEHAWSELLKEDEDEVPDMSNFRSPYSPDTRIPELSMDDLYRLLEHPNERIRFKANEEMDMRSMDAEGSNLPFDVDTTPVGEVAAFYEPQFQDLGFTYGNQQPPSLEEGVYNEEGYDEHYSQTRAGDVIEAMPGDIETTPSLAAKYEHLKNTAPPEVVESYRNRMKGFFDENTQGMINTELGIDIPPTYTPQPSKDTYTPEEMMQHNDRIFDKFRIYPSGQKGFTGFKDDWQNILASEPMEHAWSELLKAPPYKPKGLPTGVPHAVNTGKSRAETERDIHADIQRRNRTHIPVMANLNEALLTSAQREQLPAMRNLIARYGGVANIPPKRLFTGGVANFLPASQTVAVEKPFRGYPGERKIDHSNREKGQPLTFANLRPSKIEDNLTAQFLPTAAHAVEAGDYMADLATFAHNIGRFSDDRMANINAPLPEPTPEPTPEPQPVQEDKIEPGPYPGTYYVTDSQMGYDRRYMDAYTFPQYQAQKNGEQKSEPMDHAWSELLKSKRMKEKKDKDEESKKFRPSTGAFDRPKGGFGGRPMTPARAKIISRNLPVGRHTGLNLADLSVEMSHRGIASKQPKSKDPQQYLDYMATQEAQKRLGNVRTPSGEHRRFGRPSLRNIPHPQKPRLHPVRAPRIQPPKGVRKPRLNKPKMPSIVTMSEDDVAHSDLMKSRSDIGQMRILVRELREALRDARDKDKKRKGMGTPDTSGAASNLPNHPSNSANQTSKPQGGTENEEAEAKMYGADPAQVINARGSNRS